MQVIWKTGKKAEIVSVEGERVTVRSEAAYAPGAPVEGVLVAHPSQGVIVKVHGCRKEGEAYVITGRLVNLTRELKALLAPPTEG